MPGSLRQWLDTLESRHPVAIDLGLERCGRVYRNLGAPLPATTVFTVAGTNGKGSVVAFLGRLLGAAGMRWGTYTSPHILRFNERISLGGSAVSDRRLVAALEEVEGARQGESLTYFEFTTLAALRVLQTAELDAAVLEVGLGGRLDAVNLVSADYAILTRIGLDHQEHLGPDRESIGFEKAGILRAGRPVVCGDRDPPASVLRQSEELGAPLYRLGGEFEVAREAEGLRFVLGRQSLHLPLPGLAGSHQYENLATAMAALLVAFPELDARAESLGPAIRATSLPGRLQRSELDRRVVLDVGHNPLAALAIAEYLSSEGSGRRFCVLGMLADKDAEGVAATLAPLIDSWYCASLPGARGQSGSELAARVRRAHPEARVQSADSVATALATARKAAKAADTIMVCGSFATVAAALDALRSVKPQ
ncbi:MAG: bifunctional tetrahydrofolate synthase/dihydrofolate synthase [Xanthomonadales bacterium]|nr:bifunctional tetrahydrofolate synthase/dihydrofolate synthase [Xanthomonadales bacterium]NIN60721.1 bifunctional tetrahydrofolate synthase/dihydrofolate synthase [Xanthomonadales bacterium]NIN76083.1 bifunctional tetrahydrofolate synthase/dihydrofolate synthase [Xanthomonadales bacterium]NIO15304.1 bifunctional tetrahydrofolate synthase/dihydrofolate synthase [Xanthomonadales bacterium]NIP13114.1 bifunctional tetrahydrofolate synthase/dihydrofolate synthase [Xanthomonadales bacterium]